MLDEICGILRQTYRRPFIPRRQRVMLQYVSRTTQMDETAVLPDRSVGLKNQTTSAYIATFLHVCPALEQFHERTAYYPALKLFATSESVIQRPIVGIPVLEILPLKAA